MVGRTPLPPFIGGAGSIIIYLIMQITNTPLTNFQRLSGRVVKHETVYNYERSNKMIQIWLNDTLSQPYVNFYNDPQRRINKHIAQIEQVTIWVNDNREIMQMEANKKLIVDYDWFVPLFLVILAIGLFFHIYAFKETKSKTTNIKTYWNMWEYVFGKKVPIMKYNNKPYNPDDLFKF